MGLMDFALFSRLIDEAKAGGTKAITLASRGEPTLHPRFGDMLAYASDKFIDLKVNTNVTRLPEKLCHQILSSSVNELTFSIDSHDKRIYEEIRVKGNFDEVKANVEQFREIRARHYPQSRLHTRVSGVRFRADQDPEAFKSFWLQFVDDVGYVEVENRWDTYKNALRPELRHPCTYLWERMYVWFDGKTNPCDVDYKSLLSPGNIKESSITDVWRSEAYTKLRHAHLCGHRDQYNPCDRCGI